MTDATEPDPKSAEPGTRPGRLRWVWRVAVSVLVGLAGYAAWLFVSGESTRSQGERELAAARAKLEAADPNWDWEKLSAARKRPPAGKNGADLIPRIKQLTRPDWGVQLGKAEWAAAVEIEPNVRYSPRVIAQLRREVTDSARAISLARELKDRPFGHRDIELKTNPIDTLLSDTQDTRMAASLLSWDAALAGEDGDRQRAADDLLALLNAARSIGDEPILISQLVRMACDAVTVKAVERSLAQTPDTVGLAELQAALAAEAEEPLFLYGVRGERAMTDRLLENMQKGLIHPDELAKGEVSRGPFDGWGTRRFRANLPAERAFALEWTSKYVEAARRPVHEQPALLTAIPEPTDERPFVFTRLLVPSFSRVAHASWRTSALARCAVAGVACERFRQAHKRWPESLNELVPAFLPAVPVDPFDSAPLKYAKSTDGVAVYSVGTNLPARPGRADPAAKSKPGFPEGIEIGFRLWNPNTRRLPPLPDPPPAPPDEPPP